MISKIKLAIAKPAANCPKCNEKGTVYASRHASILLECQNKKCGHKWKTVSETCHSCWRPNGFAFEGLCVRCYSDRLGEKI